MSDTFTYPTRSAPIPQGATSPSDSGHSMKRRDLLLLSLASLCALPAVAAATTSFDDKLALEEISLGEGKWTKASKSARHRGYNGDADVSLNEREKFIPAAFATYATRFLLNYDEGVNAWWADTKQIYSLLPSFEERNKLGRSFGSLSSSVQIALEDFIASSSTESYDKPLEQSKIDDKIIMSRFEDLATLFFEKYVGSDYDVENMEDKGKRESIRHIVILFSMLPPEYQPIRILKKKLAYFKELPPDDTIGFGKQTRTLPVSYTEEMDRLLPSTYRAAFDVTSQSYTLSPTINLYEIGIDDEFGQNAIATPFGPLSSNVLKREIPNLPFDVYALFAISGAAGCALTHTVVIPLDVVKTRLQTNPDKYDSIIDGAVTIAKKEGIEALVLGFQATVAGYLWYGLSVYPTYAFGKRYLMQSVYAPEVAISHGNDIALIAGAMAAVVASLGLAPLEACRIRTVAEPDIYRDIGLMGSLKVIAEENPTLGWKTLYAGLPSLLVRQVIFGSVKFLAFERACENIFMAVPALRDTTITALGVSLAAGAFSGALSSVVSQPADSILTYVSKNSQGDKNLGIINGVKMMIQREGAGALFRGLGSRCLWASCIISGQFLLYDIFKNFFGVNSQDLSEVFQIVITGVK